ncbi:MAG: YfhO family protein [Saprospiraceae bacterium]|nr:YfhO family protein [Saprospiraceae bacterium]
MSKLTDRFWVKHLIAIVIFVATALIYFYPTTFEGKVIGNQTDRIQSIARQHEVQEFREQENRPIYWTNAIFSGMPSTLIGGGDPNTYDYITRTTLNIFRLFSPVTTAYALFFGGFLGMYFLLLVLKVDWRLAIGGAILYGLSTSHLLILEGGHFNKLQSIIFCPPFLASLILLLRGRIWVGTALLALFGSVLLRTGHVQIIFYFGILMGLFLVFRLVRAYRQDENVTSYGRHLLFILLAAVIAFLPNLYRMWALQSYGEESIRGKTELVQEDKPSEGLTKDYAFSWSMGKVESMSVLIPNIMGATSAEAFISDRESATFKALRGNPQANQLAQFTRKYWGDQPFVGGAYYYGVVLIFLFLAALFVIPPAWRWWSLASLAVIFILGWGRNFSAVNYFLFENIPPFNKFRAVNMIFILGHIIILLTGFKGLDRMLRMGPKESWPAIKKGAAITGGLILLALIMSYTMSLVGPNDHLIQNQTAFLEALREDRASIIRSDVWRALFFLLVAFGLYYAWLKEYVRMGSLIFLLLILGFMDIFTVNLRYVYPDKFVEQRDFDRVFSPRPVDRQILQDGDLHYRVFDLSSGDPFNNNISAYHHRLVGGYHPAKLRRYQEVIERYLSKPDQFPHIFNMLNTKYYIQNNQQNQPVAFQNDEALGNAWFVEEIVEVEDANAEIARLQSFDPERIAVVNDKFMSPDIPKQFGPSTGNTIRLTNYIPDHLTYEYSADKDRLLVFSEIYYPEEKGWKVYVDGERVDLMRANYILNAAVVPAGTHELELRFEADGRTAMLSVSRIGSILLTLMVLFMLYRLYRSGGQEWLKPSLITPARKKIKKRKKRRS